MVLGDGVALGKAEVLGGLKFGFTANLKLLLLHVELFAILSDNLCIGSLTNLNLRVELIDHGI